MDELRFKQRGITHRSLRRLALLAAINCTTFTFVVPATTECHATDPVVQLESSTDLRAMLSEGWDKPSSNQSRSSKATHPENESLESLLALPEPEPQKVDVVPETKRLHGLVPIQIDVAQEITKPLRQQPVSTLRYADLPSKSNLPTRPSLPPRIDTPARTKLPAKTDVSARTVASKFSPTTRSSQNQQLPVLPPPAKNSSKRSAFTMPDSIAADSVDPVQARKLSTANDGHLHRSMKDLKTDALRSIASKRGFRLLDPSEPKTQRQKPVAKPVTLDLTDIRQDAHSVHAALRVDSTVQANKLGEIAAEQLRDATGRLRRGATHSAKRLAIQAIRNLVALQDVREGNNQNARHLDVALTAIRESEDFGRKFGTLEPEALQRLVVAHKTTILKHRDLTRVSPMRATEAYLAVAREEIVMATASVGMASDALVLLGKVESQIAPPSDPRSGAVTLSLHQAAVEVDPANSRAWLELGTTMLREGLVDESVEVLSRSVEIQPSRVGYERLMMAAQQAQDVSAVQTCQMALANPHLQRQIPVRQLDQESFAAMYKPTNAIARNSAKPAGKTAEDKTEIEAQTVSSKSKRFGLLRSWVMPKKNR